MADCEDRDLLLMMRDLWGSNDTLWQEQLSYITLCNGNQSVSASVVPKNMTKEWLDGGGVDYEFGKDVYAYLTPFIIVVGILGNLTSLRIFTIKAMQAMSAGLYLAAISLSDLLVILTFVLLEWLSKGLQRLSGEGLNVIHIQGICQLFLLFSYTFRFTSVWLIVVFTIERYIAIDKPLHRRILCTRTLSRRFIASVFIIGFIISLYKPTLSGVVKTYRFDVCAARYKTLNFYLDAVYGILITIIPLVTITVFNCLILRALLARRDVMGSRGKAQDSKTSPSMANMTPQRENNVREIRLRLEFTMILLAVSTSFICLNLPFFVVWVQHFLLSSQQQSHQFIVDQQDNDGVQNKSGLFALTKTIFFFNYCINFFLYALTGRQFRIHLRSMFTCAKRRSISTPTKINNTKNSIDSDAYGTFNLKTMV